ncbi:IS21 family transposase [Catellatospora sp. NPDC049609]|uniref:IS21 family transposase n=1 Tax=Catellatospora sp. NPDC049609 TaxID=3155505 RepID=UPI003442BF7F
MKSNEEIMEILAAYDLTGSYRKAAELAGCDHHTVRRYVQLRGTGVDPATRQPRPKMIDAFLPKVEELVEASFGKIGADQVHKKLVAMGYDGTDRTTRRAVAAARQAFRAGHRRVHRPWVTEPGLWMQWDWGEGPRLDGRRTSLWCCWLAWSRFRVVIPVLDRTIPTVAACLDATFRAFGGVPTYCLTDNEKTVTTGHIATIPVRNPDIVPIGRFYGTVIRTCVPADPASKGGAENAVKIAKRDLVPTLTNLRGAYETFTQIEQACDEFMAEVNTRVHRETRRRPVEMLDEERFRLHRVPEQPFTAAFGTTRQVHDKDSTIRVDQVRYSVPHQHAGRQVFVRWHGDELVVTGIVDGVAAEITRHRRSTPGNPVIVDAHYPPSARGQRTPRPQNAAEEAFLAIGPGAASWLEEAAAEGVRGIASKMAEAVAMAKLRGVAAVDRALGTAAMAGRFADADLRSILDHQALGDGTTAPSRATENHSLQPGTRGWTGFGQPPARP